MAAMAEEAPPLSDHKRRSIVPSSRLGPASDAAEALRRLLALIDTLREQQDLTPERVAEFSGLTLLERLDGSGDLEGHQRLTPSWRYGYHLWSDFYTRQTVLAFSFHAEPGLLRRAPPKTDICVPDMDQIHDAVLRMGFANTRNVLSGSPERHYRRGRLVLRAHYTGESAARVTHDCLSWVFVALVPDEEISR